MKLLLPNIQKNKMSLKNKIWNCYCLISKKIKNEFKKIKYEIVTP